MSFVAGIKNQDSSYFKISSSKLSTEVYEKDIISFKYDEKVGQMDTGSLAVRDENFFYSSIFTPGIPLEIEWGYEKEESLLDQLGITSSNKDELFGRGFRTKVKATVKNPSGSASNNNVKLFNCSFYSAGALGDPRQATHFGLTKGALIAKLFLEMGITKFYVNFTRQNELLTPNTAVLQRFSNFYELRRLSLEWRALLKIGYDSSGLLSAVFISPDQLDNPLVAKTVTQAVLGNSIFLEYGDEKGNVESYTWSNHAGDGGSGSNVHINLSTNPPTFQRYVSRGDTVYVYTLKPEIMSAELEAAENVFDKIRMLRDWLGASEFEEVRRYFVLERQTTAPEGLGYSMKAKVMGKPLTSPLTKIVFGKGFPTWFNSRRGTYLSNFFIQGITHTVDRSGYKMDLEIQDTFTAFGGRLL